MLFNEPKLLKFASTISSGSGSGGFSALQRAEIAEMARRLVDALKAQAVSVLFNEPKLLKSSLKASSNVFTTVSVLFNEPKLLKSSGATVGSQSSSRFSALQRAEIAEIALLLNARIFTRSVSVLFNEPKLLKWR